MGYLFNKKSFRKGNELKKYKVNQGICTDGTYIYSIFERKKSQECRIRKFTFDNKTIMVSKPLRIGHGNDITYKDGWLYITHSRGSDVIHRVNANTLKCGENIRINIPQKISKKPCFNGIAATHNGFVLKMMGRQRIIQFDSNWKYERSFKLRQKFVVSQGMEWHNGRLYRVYSNYQKSQNKVAVFDSKGNLVKLYIIKAKGEAEGIFFSNGKFYLSIYRKYKKEGHKKQYKSRLYCLKQIK